MKVAYCGHSFHQKTKSTSFLTDLLTSNGHSIEYYWDYSWEGGAPVRFKQISSYDAILIFQSIPHNLPGCIAKAHPNVTLIPMLDQFGIAKGPLFVLKKFWKPFRGSKVLSFSSAVHAIATSNGIASKRFQYMPSSASNGQSMEIHLKKDHHNVFFWARRPSEVSIGTLEVLLSQLRNTVSIHVHLSADPGEVGISENEAKASLQWCNHLKTTQWVETREELVNMIKGCSVYIAPRLEEGIGQSFLEALSAGLCVVAPNNGTMNEYIIDGVNGVLYDPYNIKPLRLEYIDILRENALLTSEKLRENWEDDQQRLVEYITSPSKEFYSEKDKYHGVHQCPASMARARLQRVLIWPNKLRSDQ
jgi:glycosyltransferase involved in cell wall biosynthesis